jgi:hypothetical protein
MDVEGVVRLAAVVLQAAAIIVTAVFAVLGLRAWRAQVIGKRKVEIAEETLVLAHKVRSAIAYARMPVHGSREGLSRPREIAEDEDFRKVKDSYFVPVERLRAYDEDFALLERQQLLCEVYFGRDVREPLEAISRVRASILRAARKLLASDHGKPVEPDELAALKRCEAAIWNFGDFDESVAAIERALRPYVKS